MTPMAGGTPNPFVFSQPVPVGQPNTVAGMPYQTMGSAAVDMSPMTPAPPTFMDKIKGIFSDPNFYRILGEGAGAVGPGTIGDRMGQVGSKAIGAIQQQQATEKAESQRQQQNQALIKALGGITPSGRPGVTGIKVNPKGGLTIDYDMPTEGGPFGETGAPSGPVNPAPMGTGFTAYPTSNAGGSATGGGVELSELLPFLSGRGRR